MRSLLVSSNENCRVYCRYVRRRTRALAIKRAKSRFCGHCAIGANVARSLRANCYSMSARISFFSYAHPSPSPPRRRRHRRASLIDIRRVAPRPDHAHDRSIARATAPHTQTRFAAARWRRRDAQLERVTTGCRRRRRRRRRRLSVAMINTRLIVFAAPRALFSPAQFCSAFVNEAAAIVCTSLCLRLTKTIAFMHV